jgi:hypothetical protein
VSPTGPVARTPADSPKAADAQVAREARSLGEQSSTYRASTFACTQAGRPAAGIEPAQDSPRVVRQRLRLGQGVRLPRCSTKSSP